MTCKETVARLDSMANPANVAGMARYGISTEGTLGVSMPSLRALAKEIRRDHGLACELWSTGIHEARILATLVADPKQATVREMERWVRDVDSWDVCDQLCQNLLRYTPFAFETAAKWSEAKAEFKRRAAFSLMAGLAVKSKRPDEEFHRFFPLIARAAVDERNMVKKAVNWALRQIGKRSEGLRVKAMAVAEEIQRLDSRAARWVAADALRELRGR
jgi:3-methyladenine DNA glycosylase AlkD